jgi:putative transposase
MGIARSTFYDAPTMVVDDTALVEAMHAIKDEFEAYGWRRMRRRSGNSAGSSITRRSSD